MEIRETVTTFRYRVFVIFKAIAVCFFWFNFVSIFVNAFFLFYFFFLRVYCFFFVSHITLVSK